MPIDIYVADAFTDQPFRGNPAAVCLLEEPAPAEWMQLVAAEMNLSETAFLVPAGDGFGLRWFTPRLEVDLCGHATLASAHVLWETGRWAEPAIRFETAGGVLSAGRREDGIALSFPLLHPERAAAPPAMLSALGLDERCVIESVRSGSRHVVRVASPSEVWQTAPDFGQLRRFEGSVAVTAASADSGADFVSRYFAANMGIDEDPVTGSIHCLLAPYWAEILGTRRLRAVQASVRSGRLELAVLDGRVELKGTAVTTLKAQLTQAAAWQPATGARTA
jgi:PhzF family phenazine biosynthesis protein